MFGLGISINPSIMFADPNDARTTRMKMLLRAVRIGVSRFHSVPGFSHARVLLDQAESSEKPTLVFLDTELTPEGVGWLSLLKEIRNNYNGTVLIAVLGDTDDRESTEAAKKHGANAFIRRGPVSALKQRLGEFKQNYLDRSRREFAVIG